jgi:ketosteroid isomerase-like protein
MENELIQFARNMDRCWLEGRFDDLASYVADDAVLASADGKRGIEGCESFVGTYREFMSRSDVLRFETSYYLLTERGQSAVVEYDWSMTWKDQGGTHSATGREVLVLAQRGTSWCVIWRLQLST